MWSRRVRVRPSKKDDFRGPHAVLAKYSPHCCDLEVHGFGGRGLVEALGLIRRGVPDSNVAYQLFP